MSKRISIGLALTITLLAMTATVSVTMIFAMRIFDSTVQSVKEKEAMYEKIGEIDQVARNNFLFEINDGILYDMLSAGFVAGLSDRTSRYYTPKQYADYQGFQDGKIVGVGVDAVKDAAGHLKVIRVFSDSPAADAEIAVGTTIRKIGDVDVRTLTQDAAIALLRAEQGTETVLTYSLSGGADEQTVTLLRRGYITPAIEYSNQENDTGYIKILNFSATAASELDYAITVLRKGGATGIVIDLRGVSGTNYEAATRVSDIFIKKTEIASLYYKDGTRDVLYTTETRVVNIPVVLLVNSGTSGAAELFAITLKNFAEAKTVGVRTAGRGTATKFFRLSDGSAVELTVAKIIPKDSEEYDVIGINPDFEVQLKAEQELYFYDLTFTDDTQYLKAAEMLLTLKRAAGIEPTPQTQTQDEPKSEN